METNKRVRETTSELLWLSSAVLGSDRLFCLTLAAADQPLGNKCMCGCVPKQVLVAQILRLCM